MLKKAAILEKIKKLAGQTGALQWMLKQDDSLCYDKDIMLEMIKQDPSLLAYAKKNIQNEYLIVLEAIKKDGYALKYASQRLQQSKELILMAVSKNGLALQFVHKKYQSDKQVALTAIASDAWAFRFISENLKNDIDIIIETILNNGFLLSVAPDKWKNNKILKMLARNTTLTQHPNIDEIRNILKQYPMEYVYPDATAMCIMESATDPILTLALYIKHKHLPIIEASNLDIVFTT